MLLSYARMWRVRLSRHRVRCAASADEGGQEKYHEAAVFTLNKINVCQQCQARLTHNLQSVAARMRPEVDFYIAVLEIRHDNERSLIQDICSKKF